MSTYTKPVIGLDVDGVIFDYLHGLIAFARMKGIAAACESDEVTDWNMTSAFPNMPQSELFDLIHEFNQHEDFGKLRPYDNAEASIRSLRNEFPGNPIVAVTSAGHTEATKTIRMESLSHLPFDEIHVLPIGASKSEYFAEWPAGSLFVDDLMKNIRAAEQTGVTGILVRRPYNTQDSHAYEANTWEDIVGYIREILSLTPNRKFAI